MMKALSILQPYPWLIVRPDLTDQAARARARAEGKIKDIENRDWRTHVRERILVHAGKKYSRRDHDFYVDHIGGTYGIELPSFADMLAMTGGIVGSVEIVDCVQDHPSKWKLDGTWGMVLKDARPEPYRPLRGMLGFFGVPAACS
jgi:hypothetical protein